MGITDIALSLLIIVYKSLILTTTAGGERLPLYLFEKQTLENIMQGYEKTVRPHPPAGGPTNVALNVYVRSISSINEMSMDFNMDIVLRELWNDPRLSFNTTLFHENELKFLKPAVDFTDRIWQPDTFFPTARSGIAHDITVPNRMLRIHPNGDVLYTQRYSLVLSCPMNLVKYPFDAQECVVSIGSYSFTDDMLRLIWQENAIQINKDLSLPKFMLAAHEIVDCVNVHPTGNFSCLKFKFKFTRQIGFHVVEAFVPTTLLVMASWLAFWIDPSSVPGRVSLAVTTMLTTVAQSRAVKNSLPPVSYVKAIDIWLGSCISFVFAALVEYAVVNSLFQKEQRASKKPQSHQSTTEDDTPCTVCCGKARRRKGKLPTSADSTSEPFLAKRRNKFNVLQLTSTNVDRLSRIVFPFCFLLFVVIYCMRYAF